MNTKPLLPSLLLALAAGFTLQAHAAQDEATSLPAQSCQSAHHELDAIAVHLREARADRRDEATAPSAHEKLALELEAHLLASVVHMGVHGANPSGSEIAGDNSVVPAATVRVNVVPALGVQGKAARIVSCEQCG